MALLSRALVSAGDQDKQAIEWEVPRRCWNSPGLMDLTGGPPMEPAYVEGPCKGCGVTLGRGNKHGYCHRNPDCSRKAYAAAQRAHRARQPGERPGRGRGPHYHGRPHEGELVTGARRRARKLGLECTITVWDVEIPERCPVLGIPLARGTWQDRDGSPSIDRIDPAGGYTPDNIQVISAKANRMKNDATAADLLLFAAWVNRHLGAGHPEGV